VQPFLVSKGNPSPLGEGRVRVKKPKMKIYIYKENKEFKRGETPSYKNHPLNTESGEFKRGAAPLRNLSSLSLGRGSG
jgi:hypothetical protein